MLQLHFEDSSNKTVWLVEPEYILGSSPTCSLPVPDEHLKREHAKLTITNDKATLINLVGDSMVRVNGVPVSHPRELSHGDILNVGFTEIRLVDTSVHVTQVHPTEENVAITPWVLKPLVTALAGKEFEIVGAAVLGRSKECDISLKVSHLSRRHAMLTVTERGLQVEDLSSANGTFVNGQKIAKTMLKPGDQLRFDSLAFQIEGPQPDVELTTVRPVLRVAESRAASLGDAHAAQPSAAAAKPKLHPPSRMTPAYGGGVQSAALEAKPKPYFSFGVWVVVAVALCASIALWLLK